MSCRAKDLLYEAEKRLQEVEHELNHTKLGTTMRASNGDKIDLIQERLQLRLLIGDLQLERRPMGLPAHCHDNSHLTKDGRMNIEFESGESASLRFHMVKDGQMFVADNGCLFQKSGNSDNEAWQICDSGGQPEGAMDYFEDDEIIHKILPIIRRIAF